MSPTPSDISAQQVYVERCYWGLEGRDTGNEPSDPEDRGKRIPRNSAFKSEKNKSNTALLIGKVVGRRNWASHLFFVILVLSRSHPNHWTCLLNDGRACRVVPRSAHNRAETWGGTYSVSGGLGHYSSEGWQDHWLPRSGARWLSLFPPQLTREQGEQSLSRTYPCANYCG